eukprot:1780652-Alexandrium_andersonii.AAC.1
MDASISQLLEPSPESSMTQPSHDVESEPEATIFHSPGDSAALPSGSATPLAPDVSASCHQNGVSMEPGDSSLPDWSGGASQDGPRGMSPRSISQQ